MNCYEAIDVMGEAVEGRLDPALDPSFQEHVTECRPCGNYYDQLRITRQALRQLPAAGVDDASRRKLLEAFRSEFDRETH